jgi:membrane protease YdiL (CAAX protease family)
MTPPRWILLALCAVLPALAWRLGGASLWYALVLGYGAAASLAAWELAQDDQLKAALVPRAGDATLGLLPALVLFTLVSLFVTRVLAPLPELRYFTPDGAWVGRADAHGLQAAAEWLRERACAAMGRASAIQGSARVAFVLAIAALEELAWRGGVQQGLSERFGSTRGWLLASGLYALAQLGTFNAAPALLALPCGLLWGAMYRFRGRLAPSILSHAIFSWALFAHNSSPFIAR